MRRFVIIQYTFYKDVCMCEGMFHYSEQFIVDGKIENNGMS